MKWYLAALLILGVALAMQFSLLAYAMYALLSVLVASRLVARSWVNRIRAVRECNQLSVRIGESVAVVITMENTGRLPIAWLLAEDLLPVHALIHDPPNLKVQGRRVQLSMLKPGGRRSMFYQLTCNRRGYYQIGPLVVETGDLFGLHRRYRVLTAPHFLLVYPRVIPLESFDVGSRRPIGEVRMSHRLFEDPTRIAGVRQYMPGDPLARIHWRATAATNQLHSKLFEPSTVAGATLLLDFHQDSFRRGDEPYRSELAVTATASIAGALYEMGQQVGLVSNGRDAVDRIRQEGWDGEIRTRDAARRAASMRLRSDRLEPVRVQTGRGPQQLMQILTALARLEQTDGLTMVQLISETTSRLPRDASVIAVLTAVTPETAIALGTLRRRGFAVSAILNVYEPSEFAQASEPLLAEGVETRHLRDESAVPTVCGQLVLQGSR